MIRATARGCGLVALAFCLAAHGGAAQQAPPQRWAIVIGINDYEDKGLEDLSEAVHDAQAVHDVLIGLPEGFPEENMTLLIDGNEKAPTRSNLIRYLTSSLRLPGTNDTILLYFAGHGMTKDGALYLLPSDAASINIEQTGLAFAEVQRLLDECKAKKKVMILDACHSGTGRSNDTMDEDFARELERASSGKVLLASCTANERSYEMPKTGHGAFTYFLLEGLKGAADKDDNGFITATELSIYTFEKTRRWAKEEGLSQTPMRRAEVSGEITLGRYRVAGRGGEEENVVPSTGALEVEVDVPDAVVEVDGKGKGIAAPGQPFKLEGLPAGEIRVSVSAPGCESQIKEVIIKTGQLTRFAFEFKSMGVRVGKPGEMRNLDGIDFVWIPEGSFMMGSGLAPSDTKARYGGTIDEHHEEHPQHLVTISKGFWMGTFEVTQAQWQAVMGTNPSKFKATDCPVERVSWDDAQEFIARLNEKGENGYRLPTEAEWEYACRAGSATAFSCGDGPACLAGIAWFEENSRGETQPVGQKKANPWGLCDMHGNVWEWCQDGMEDYPAGSATDPLVTSLGSGRVKRGGSFSDPPGKCRAAARAKGFRDEGEANLGFRLVRQ